MTPKDFIATPGRQLAVAAVGLVVLLAVLLTVYVLWLRTPYTVLFADLRPADAATIVAELDKKKTPYQLKDGGRTILAPAKLADAARLDLMSQDLPLKGTVGFELFNKSDMGLTEFAQQINYRRALQGELARTIMALDGVESARVHLSLAAPSVFREDRRAAKASVTLIAPQGRAFAPETVRGVRSLVAAAVEDLSAADVVILDGQGRILGYGDGAADLDPGGRAAAIEADLARSLTAALARAFPDRSMEATVNAPAAARALQGDGAVSARDYSLAVRITVDGDVDPATRVAAQQLAISVLALDPALGDAVTVIALRPVAQGAPAPPPPSLSTRASPASPPPVRTLIFGALVVLVLTAAGLWRVRPGRRSLDQRQTERYAARLSQLLTQEAERG